MAKILIVGNPDSPLVRERGLAGQSAGHKIYWFSTRKADIPGVKSYGLSKFVAKLPLLNHLLASFFFARAIKAIQPDLIHVHYASKGILALLLSRFHPLLVTTMGSDISPTVGYRGLYALFTRYLLENADCITVKSAYMIEMLNQIGNYAHKIELIRWGVDLDLFSPDRDTKALREKLAVPNGAITFFDPRASRPLYNKHILLNAFRYYLDQKGPDAILLISEFNSDLRYLKLLKQKMKELGLEKKVRFLSRQSAEAMADLYALAESVISIPSSDGFPQSIYEAWASGAFPILGDLPQYRQEVTDGIDAKLVQIGDTQGLTNAMLWVARRPQVREAAKQANRAKALASLDRSRQYEKLNQLYSKLLIQQR